MVGDFLAGFCGFLAGFAGLAGLAATGFVADVAVFAATTGAICETFGTTLVVAGAGFELVADDALDDDAFAVTGGV